MAITYTGVTIPKNPQNQNIPPNQNEIYDVNPGIGTSIGNLGNITAKPIVPNNSPVEQTNPNQTTVSTDKVETQPLPGKAIADTSRPTLPGTQPRSATIEQDIDVQVEQLRAQGRNQEANDLVALKNDYGNWFGLSNGITSVYDGLENVLDGFYAQYAGQMSNVEKDLVGKLAGQFSYIQNLYGPNGTQTKALQSYYKDFGNQLSGQSAEQIALTQADATQGGVGESRQRIAVNEINRKAADDALKLKQQEITDLDNLYKTYDQYVQNFIGQYGNVKNAFTTTTLNNLLSYKTQLANQVAAKKSAILEGVFNTQLAGRPTSTSSTPSVPTPTNTPAAGDTVVSVAEIPVGGTGVFGGKTWYKNANNDVVEVAVTTQ